MNSLHPVSITGQNPQLQQLASIPGGTIFEIVAELGAPIVGT